jgi:hypothetical protein
VPGRELRLLLVVVLLQAASLREWSRVVAGPGALIAAFVAALVASVLLDRVARIATGVGSIAIAWTGLVVAVAAIGSYYTASLDGLAGSDRDEAIIVSAERLMRGEHPYAAPTYLGNPLSPGPGWVVLHVPFVALGLYWLVPASAWAVLPMAAALATTERSKVMMRTIVLSAGAPVMWHELVTGSDLLTAGVIGGAAVVLSAGDIPSGRRRLSTVALAAFMTSRAPFLLGGAGFYAASRAVGGAAAIALGALAVSAVAWVALFAMAPTHNSPLHLLTRAQVIFPPPALVAALIATVVTLGIVSRSLAVTTARRLWNFGLVLLVPLSATAAASLARAGWDLASWVGASYLVPAAVPLLLACALEADFP